MSSLVTLQDYADGSIFPGLSSANEIRDLVKALSAGQDINNPGISAGSGFPLRVESLDDVLKVLTFGEDDLVLWKDVSKSPAFNTVEEHNVITSVGNEVGVNIAEGELPEEDDSTYDRRYTIIKYMGTLRRISHVMGIVKQALPDSVVAAETRAGTLKLLRANEIALLDNNATADATEYDGFFAQFISGICGYATGAASVIGTTAWFTDIDTVIATGLLQDRRYLPTTQDSAAEMVEIVSEDPNHGKVTDLYLPFRGALEFSKQFYSKERGELSSEGEVGTVATKINTPFGKVAIKPMKFNRITPLASQTGVGNASRRPATPTLGIAGATSPALGANPGPGYGGAVQGRTAPAAVDGTGNYYFQVVACNRYGKSAPLSIGPVAVTVGDRVDLPIVDGSPAGVTTYYEIYRTLRNAVAATSARKIFRAHRTAISTMITDFNHFLPKQTSRFFFKSQPLFKDFNAVF